MILITKLLYSKTVKHPSGTYEKLEAEGLIQGEADLAFNELKSFVDSSLGYPDSTPSDKIAEVIGGGKVLRTDGKIATAIDNKEVDEPKKEAVKGAKTSKKAKKEVEQEAEAEAEETEAEVEVAKPAKKDKKINKLIPYDRGNDTLKARFTELMGTTYPNWKKDKASLENAKKTSLAMEGVDFLDADGEILESFVETMKSNMESDL